MSECEAMTESDTDSISSLELFDGEGRPRTTRALSEVQASTAISRDLKPMYHSFLKQELFILSATISDDNSEIVPDDDSLQKPFVMDTITTTVTKKLATEYLDFIQGEANYNDYKKPRFIFVNNTVKPILIRFIPTAADFDKRMWFEGTMMSLKASLKCNLPITNVETYDDLEVVFGKLHEQLLEKRLTAGV